MNVVLRNFRNFDWMVMIYEFEWSNFLFVYIVIFFVIFVFE